MCEPPIGPEPNDGVPSQARHVVLIMPKPAVEPDFVGIQGGGFRIGFSIPEWAREAWDRIAQPYKDTRAAIVPKAEAVEDFAAAHSSYPMATVVGTAAAALNNENFDNTALIVATAPTGGEGAALRADKILYGVERAAATSAARGASVGAAHVDDVMVRFAERGLMGSSKHGVKWTEGAARAKSTGISQGQFGSKADVDWVVHQSHRVAPGSNATVPLPAGHTSYVHLPGGGTAPANQAFIKVYPSGKVHAYPLQ
jgi:hypothetical protein